MKDKKEEETLAALWRLARAANNMQDFLEIPISLEAGSRQSAWSIINEFKEALKALKVFL